MSDMTEKIQDPKWITRASLLERAIKNVVREHRARWIKEDGSTQEAAVTATDHAMSNLFQTAVGGLYFIGRQTKEQFLKIAADVFDTVEANVLEDTDPLKH